VRGNVNERLLGILFCLGFGFVEQNALIRIFRRRQTFALLRFRPESHLLKNGDLLLQHLVLVLQIVNLG